MLEYYKFKEINDLFLKGRIEEARHLLTEMQTRYVALSDENILLRSQVQEFEDILYLSRNLVFDGFCYWLMTGEIKQGPFCETCYNRDGVLVRLDSRSKSWQCPSCGTLHDRYAEQPIPAAQLAAPRLAKVIPFTK